MGHRSRRKSRYVGIPVVPLQHPRWNLSQQQLTAANNLENQVWQNTIEMRLMIIKLVTVTNTTAEAGWLSNWLQLLIQLLRQFLWKSEVTDKGQQCHLSDSADGILHYMSAAVASLCHCRVLSLSDRRYSLNPLSQTRIDWVGRYRIRWTFKLSCVWH